MPSGPPATPDRIPTHMPTDNRPANAGVSLDDDASRLEGVAKVTGAARYARDTYPHGALFLVFIRCPFGAATLRAHDTSRAEAMPGVVEIELFHTEGKHHGQPVGYVLAESERAARRAIRAIDLRWTPSPPTTSIEDAAPAVPPPSEATASHFSGAPRTLHAVYTTHVQTHACAETHGGVVEPTTDGAIVTCSTQGTFIARDALDEALGLPLSKIEVRCEHVGGGFGSKQRAGKETLWAARLAAKHRRPVYCFVDRAEDAADTGARSSAHVHVDVAFDETGAITGGRIHSFGGVGVAGDGGVAIPSHRYALPQIERTHESVRFNAGAERPFRGPGDVQGAFAEELMLDEIATALAIDPLDLRLRLAAHDDLRAVLTLGAQLIGWSRRRPTGAQDTTIRRGLGVGTTSWGRFSSESRRAVGRLLSRVNLPDSWKGPQVRVEAEVVINADGSVEARTGTQDIGTGQRTAMAICVAHQLGVPLDRVSVRIGSSKLPYGPTSAASLTVSSTAPAMMMAADDAKAQLLALIPEANGAPHQNLTIADAMILSDGDPLMTWADACRRLGPRPIIGRGTRDGAERYIGTGNSFGAQFVDLEVDTATGQIRVDRIVAVQECGRVLCRKTAESQIIGAVTQGISFALYENRVLDRATGVMLNADLEMYKWAGARDVPRIEPVLYTRDQTGPRPLGEAPTIPTAGAIACAVYNAIGTPIRALPLTPDAVLAALSTHT